MSTPSQQPNIHPSIVALRGTVLDDRYQIGRMLGAGGMGAVFEATQLRLDRRVAIKVLRAVFAGQEEFIKRFMQEAKAASKIEHRNVVEIFDYGETTDGLIYSVMKFLRGDDLEQVLRGQTDQRLPWGQACALLVQIASGLKAAHDQGVIHRDIKPANCILTHEDAEAIVKVVDFGIAKVADADQVQQLTRTDDVLGTPAYIAPELVRKNNAASPRSDVYSLGVLAYRMLAGCLPFIGETSFEVLRKSCFDPVPSLCGHAPDLPPAVEAFVFSLLAKEPDDRPPDMLAVREGLLALGRETLGPEAVVAIGSGALALNPLKTDGVLGLTKTMPIATPAKSVAGVSPGYSFAPTETLEAPEVVAESSDELSRVEGIRGALDTMVVEAKTGSIREESMVRGETMRSGDLALLETPDDEHGLESVCVGGNESVDPKVVALQGIEPVGPRQSAAVRSRVWVVVGLSSVLFAISVGLAWIVAWEKPEVRVAADASRELASAKNMAPELLEVRPHPAGLGSIEDASSSSTGPPTWSAPLANDLGSTELLDPISAVSEPVSSDQTKKKSSESTKPSETIEKSIEKSIEVSVPPSDSSLVRKLKGQIKARCWKALNGESVTVSFVVNVDGRVQGLTSEPRNPAGDCAIVQVKATVFRPRFEDSFKKFTVG